MAVVEETDIITRAAEAISKQGRFKTDFDVGSFWDATRMWVQKSWSIDPMTLNDDRERDKWLVNLMPLEPHLAGVIASATEINKNRGWSITGAMRQVRATSGIFYAADKKGWRHYVGKGSVGYYCTRMGFLTELSRTSAPPEDPDAPVPALTGIFNLDPTRCILTGNSRRPLKYYPAWGDGGEIPLKERDFIRAVSMPSIEEDKKEYGFPAVQRCLALAQMMLAVFEHDRETLGAAPPAGFLSISGISDDEFKAKMAERKVKRDGSGQTTYRDIMVLCSNSVPVEVKLTSLSQLPVNWSLVDWVQLLMQGYSLCIGYDVSEFYSVRAGGGLGIATATEEQAKKSTAKGEWDFILAFDEGIRPELPMSVSLEWDERSDSGDKLRAETDKIDVDWIVKLYTAREGGTPEGLPLINNQQALFLLAQQGIVPRSWIGEDDSQNTDLGIVRTWREKAMDDENVRRSAYLFPTEPVIRRDQKGHETVLWWSGDEMLTRRVNQVTKIGEKSRAIPPEVDAQDVETAFEAAQDFDPKLAAILMADLEEDEA